MQLAEQNLGLAWAFAWKFAKDNRDVDVDDLASEALYALTYAASRYDGRVPFVPYATMVIRHRLIQWVRRARLRKTAHFAVDQDGETWQPMAPAELDGATQSELLRCLNDVMPERWLIMLRLYAVEAWTMKEIGARFGVSRQRAQELVRKAINKARLRLREELLC